MDSQVIVGFCAGQNLSVPTIGVVRPPDSKPPITITITITILSHSPHFAPYTPLT